MLSHIFLGLSLIGAEWVLYLLVLLSVISVAVIIERVRFYSQASKGIATFRSQVRQAASQGKWQDAAKLAEARTTADRAASPDLESAITLALLSHTQASGSRSTEVLNELAQDAVMRTRLHWDRNLAVLATIGSNAPFIGLFGTVLGIIRAFHDLSNQTGGVQAVSAGVADALIATAIGILVAIPAIVAFNLFQRKVRSGLTQAEALKSYLVGKLAG